MRSDEIVKEYKHHNHRISAFKRVKAVSCLVPIFKLLVKGFDNIVGDVILKAGNSDVRYTKYGLCRYFVSRITISNNSIRFTVLFYTIKQAKGLWRISVW